MDPAELVKRAPLHIAARSGTTGVAEALLLHGASIDLPESNGVTAMHEAALRANLEMCSILLGHGASVNCRDAQGRTPLHFAASAASPETIQTILAATNTGVAIQDNAGQTPLHCISESLAVDTPPDTKTLLRCCDILLAQSERITTISDKELNNPLHFACQKYSECVAHVSAKMKNSSSTESVPIIVTATALVNHLSDRCPNMLLERNKRGKYPYQLLPSGDLYLSLKEQASSIAEQPTMDSITVP